MTQTKVDFMALAKGRKTTYEFSEKSVKEADVKKILEAGRWAPSTRNSQPWHFIVIKNKKSISNLIAAASYGNFHTDPPLLIAVAGIEKEDIQTATAFRGAGRCAYDLYLSASMACLNMVYEAKERGLDTCILSPMEEKAKRILKLPKQYSLPLLVGIGYQKKGAFQKQKKREELAAICSYEYFGGREK